MELLECKVCGGALKIVDGIRTCKCEYCGRVQTLPQSVDAQRIGWFNRGNRFRRKAEYDEALRWFERIIEIDDTDPEAHWCLALCRHGIEYVDNNGRKVPTCNRIGVDTILNDIDYQDAISLSSEECRNVYEANAKEIAEVQASIMQKSKSIDKFDVFICYKEKTALGQRTEDSVIAQDIYDRLVHEGIRVFFSRITLEKKAGVEYEPYIFAALQSAKVMLVIGTSTANIASPWVKNEWSRYLSIISKDNTRLLIPCIKNIKQDDLPDELALRQYVNMESVGWLQDLLHNIRKTICLAGEGQHTDSANLLHRCEQFIADKNWNDAQRYCERVLDADFQNGKAHYYLLLCEFKSTNEKELSLNNNFPDSPNCRRAIEYGDDQITHYISTAKNSLELRKLQEKEEHDKAAAHEKNQMLKTAEKFAASEAYLDKKYAAVLYCNLGLRSKAIDTFRFYDVLEDGIYTMCPSKEAYHGIIYDYSGLLVTADNHGLWKDDCLEPKWVTGAKKIRKTDSTWILYQNGKVVSNNSGKYKVVKSPKWEGIIDIQSSAKMVIGLTESGEVVTSGGSIIKRSKLTKWSGLSQISASDTLILGRTENGHVLALGENIYGQCNVDAWFDVVQVSAGEKHAVALRSDGTVYATGDNENGQCDTGNWVDILAVKAYQAETIGLKMDGSLISTNESSRLTPPGLNLFNLQEYTDYKDALSNEQVQRSTAKSIAMKISTLWEEKKKLNIWQRERRKAILDAIDSLSNQLETINKSLPEWYRVSFDAHAKKWLKQNKATKSELSSFEEEARLKVLMSVGIIVGLIGGIIFLYVDANGQGITGQGIGYFIAGLFAAAIILAIAAMIGLIAICCLYIIIKVIIAIVNQIQKI